VAEVVCPECGSKEIVRDYKRAEVSCAKCGFVLEEALIDLGPEWRLFDFEVGRARAGAPMTHRRADKGLTTEIDLYDYDIKKKKLAPEMKSRVRRMRREHRRAALSTSLERNLAIALQELDRISSYLSLPSNMREASATLYRKAVDRNLIRGRLIETVVAAVIYAICRKYDIPRTLEEMAEVSGIDKKEIGKTFRLLKANLKFELPEINPAGYVPRFTSTLNLPGNVQEKARKLIDDGMKKGLVEGRGPTGVAAAAVYIAATMCGERRSQKEVSDAAGVTEVTVRNRCRELVEGLELKVKL
jgi:transcription initiation factor TFIIB